MSPEELRKLANALDWPSMRDQLRQLGCDPERVVVYLRRQAETTAPPNSGPYINQWALREVFFDDEGHPIMSREPEQPEAAGGCESRAGPDSAPS